MPFSTDFLKSEANRRSWVELTDGQQGTFQYKITLLTGIVTMGTLNTQVVCFSLIFFFTSSLQ